MDIQHKKILKAVSLELRHLLEGQYDASSNWQPGDLERRLAAIGVRRDREAVSVDELSHLSAADQKARQVVDAYLKLRAEAGVSREDAVAEFVRETAYTWANRLLALRCMEARELIDEVILQKPAYGGRSLEHHRLAQRQPELCAGEDDGLLAALDKVFAEQARHLPLLFDPEAPGIALKPSAPAIKRCVVLLSGTEAVRNQEPATGDAFKAPDALGWAYQYWNTEEKDRVFTKVRTQKGAKIEGADIVPATQLYTEPYMVKFLVQNSLGATWMGMHPESKLFEKWEYYVRDADRVPVEHKPIAELTFLDPACGSGHFLLEAFDLLYDMYEEEARMKAEGGRMNAEADLSAPPHPSSFTLHPSAICRSILERNLFGIDIDARAVQIAEAALWMKAAERVFPDEFPGVQTNLVAAVASHLKGSLWEEFLQTFDKEPHLRNVLARFGRAMEHIDELGSLAKPEEALRAIVHDEHAQWEQARRERTDANYLFAEMRADALSGQLPLSELSDSEFGDRLLASVRAALDAFTEKARNEGRDSSRLLGRETQIGLRWIDVLARKYDVVAANPPYMGSKNMSLSLKSHVEQYHTSGKRDLYAAFILRGLEFSVSGGRVAMVTLQSWLFLGSFSDLRATSPDSVPRKSTNGFSGLLRETRIEALTQLGRHAFSEADPPTNVVLCIWQLRRPTSEHRPVFFRLAASRPASEQQSLLLRAVLGRLPDATYGPPQSGFHAIPGATLSYWTVETLSRLISAGMRVGDKFDVRRGLSTGQNDRLMRCYWEIPPHNRRWRPFAKAGGFCRWVGLSTYLVDWPRGQQAMASLSGARIQNQQYFDRPGATFSQAGRGSLGVRVLKADELFEAKSPGIFAKQGDEIWLAIAVLNCRVSSWLIRASCPAIDINETSVSELPIPNVTPETEPLLDQLVEICVSLKERLISCRLSERAFDPSRLERICGGATELGIAAVMHAVEGTLERVVMDAYQLDQTEKHNIVFETGIPVGWLSALRDLDVLPDIELGRTPLPSDVQRDVSMTAGLDVTGEQLHAMKHHLRRLYENGPNARPDESTETIGSEVDAEEELDNLGAGKPLPTETFLEEVSRELGANPISVYWLLKQGIDQGGWRCLPEDQRLTRDRVTVATLQLLGHRWPRQIEAGESVPTWADPDGIIPLTEGTSEGTLGERIVERNSFRSSAAALDTSFAGKGTLGDENGMNSVLRSDFADLMGKPLDHWLATEFFKHHISQFKKRPIAWQVQSGKFTARKTPAFACLVYYHKLDGDLLPKLCKQYAGHLQQRMETELRGIESIAAAARSDRQEARRTELGEQIPELQEFDAKLREIQESAFATDGLRAAAIQDGLLCLKQAWLRRLADAVRSGPLGQWGEAARQAAIHADLPNWIEVAMSQLDRHCTRVGPDDSEWNSDDDPTPVIAARFICTKPSQMVTDALRHANGGWEGQVNTVVIAPLRRQISEKQDRQKAIKAELKASTDGDTTVHAIGELKAELDRLKAEISDLQAHVDDIQARCDRLRAMITDWQCPGVEGWESWLAQQPLYDAISSVDGRRRPPTTVQEWIAQEQSYFPDINDGVRVNIAPLQKAGLLAADVLAKKDLHKAIADRAEWRRDERRWVREGKLPRPGWWAEEKDEG